MSFFGAIIAVHKYNRFKKKKITGEGKKEFSDEREKKAKKEWEEKGNRVI